MPFDSGSIAFRRFAVVGEGPSAIDQEILDKLFEHALRSGEIGIPQEIEYGWSGGRHVLDGRFSFEHNVYADALHFALRIDTNRGPSDLKKAYTVMEEEAVAADNPSGFISKNQKRDVKETVRRRIEDDLRSGRFRSTKLVPLLWDVSRQTVYSPASGKSFELLAEIFERTFGPSLVPLSAGSIALRLLEPHGRRRDYEDLRPTRFINGPEGEGQYPDYPWVAKGPEPKDFLGNEFMLWLWHETHGAAGSITTESGEFAILIDKSIDLDCAYGQTGRDMLRSTAPTQMPEARTALKTGKLPRKAGVVLDAHNQQFSFTFNPESFAFAGTRLPDIEEADSPRVVFEERISLLRDVCESLEHVFEAFLRVRASSAWESTVNSIRRWINHVPAPMAAVA